jgi:hypothetical protein
MIITDLDLRRKMVQAAASGRYLVMVSCVGKDGKTIEHFFKTEKFPREDLLETLNKYAEMLEPEVVKVAKGDS